MADHQSQELQNQIHWLIFFRFLTVFAFVGSLQSLDPTGEVYSYEEIQNTFRLLSVLVIANLFYFLVNRYYSSVGFLVLQFISDILFEVALVYLTGGVNSPFAVVFFATILAASVLANGRMGLICASLAVTGLATVTSLYFYHFMHKPLHFSVLPPSHFVESIHTPRFYVYYLLVHSAAFYLVAVLAGRLAYQHSEDQIVQGEILQNLGEGVIVADADGRIFYANRLSAEYLRFDEPLMEQQIVHAMNRISPGLARHILDQKEGIHEVAIDYDHGKRIYQISTAPVRGQAGKVRGTIVVIRDRTENRELENSRLALARMTALSELGAAIAHEIRNPLASIRGSVQEMHRGTDPETHDARLMNIVLKESDRLDRILTEFLQFASLKKSEYYPCDLLQLLEEQMMLFGKREDATEVSVNLDLQEELTTRLQADSEQLRQVFLNLIVNAAQAMEFQGRIDIRLQASERLLQLSRYAGDAVYSKVPGIQIEIQDQGPGFAPEALQKSFLPFYTTKRTGTGMGLAIVSRIINDHGGQIAVANHSERGAVIIVWLPLSPQDLYKKEAEA